MENKLRLLLKKMEELSSIEKCSDGSFVSLDESIAQKLRATYGSKNGQCGNNGVCTDNTACTNNGQCSNNGQCNNSPTS